MATSQLRNWMNLFEDHPSRALNNPDFVNWFKGSKVIDGEGRPQVCYHGTFEDFAEFNHENGKRLSLGFNRLGFWFDVDPRTPNYFAGYDPKSNYPPNGGNVKPCFLSINKPLWLDSEYFWDEDRQKLNDLDDLIKPMRDKPNAADKYRELLKQRDELMRQLTVSERSDSWYRLMNMLPGGVKAKTTDVIAFQQECISQGYDGICLMSTIADLSSRDNTSTHWWIAFHPHQIRSIFDAGKLHEGLWDDAAPRYDSKPAYMVPMEDEPSEGSFPVWVNPSRNTFRKILEHCHGQVRGLMYNDGKILIWDQPNLYHSDVYNQLGSQFGNDFVTLTYGKDWVAVKGDSSYPIPFEDEEWLPILQKAFAKYYPNGVKFEQFDWG